jgi:hypothetical protein
MSTEDLTDRGLRTTDPFDSSDPPRFAQLTETAKDAFAKELTSYFDISSDDISSKIAEVPNIQKFALGATAGETSLEQVIDLIQSYGVTPNKYPMVAITSSNVREKPMGIGSAFVASVQYPPSVVGTETGPFSFTDGWTLEYKTWPNGDEASETTSTMTFTTDIFADITNVTVEELAGRLNQTQALYTTFSATSDGFLRISCGGPCAVTSPNYIEITGGSAGLLLELGLTIGQSDTYLNTDNPPKNRYGIAGDMVINIDVIADEVNARTEVGDLVYDFFTFYLEKRRFQMFGRSYQDRDIDPSEWWHIILKKQFSWSGETNQPRAGGEQHSMLHAVRGSVPVYIYDFVDRAIVTPPVFLLPDNISEDTTLPIGDYSGPNWLNDLRYRG